jgi:leader peptidase (prepilin peptidase)/N-methyltransferase
MSEDWIRALVALPVGLVLGSFMTVVVARVPAKGSLVRPRSRCPSCGAPIRNRDNVPVVSWLLLRGRCRDCGSAISPRYPLLELTTGVLVAAAAFVARDAWTAVLLGALVSMLPAIAVIDLEHRIIPNRLMYPSLLAFPAFVVVAWALGGAVDPLRALLGALAYGGGLLVVAAVSGGMGFGDVKLATVIGVALGALGLRYVAVAAAAGILAGGVAAIGALALGRGRKSAIPFGPAIALGAVVSVLVGERIADAYLGTLG